MLLATAARGLPGRSGAHRGSSAGMALFCKNGALGQHGHGRVIGAAGAYRPRDRRQSAIASEINKANPRRCIRWRYGVAELCIHKRPKEVVLIRFLKALMGFAGALATVTGASAAPQLVLSTDSPQQIAINATVTGIPTSLDLYATSANAPAGVAVPLYTPVLQTSLDQPWLTVNDLIGKPGSPPYTVEARALPGMGKGTYAGNITIESVG